MVDDETFNYGHADATPGSDDYLVPRLKSILAAEGVLDGALFDLGAGNGWVAGVLSDAAYVVTGVEPSEDGVRIANERFPKASIVVGSAYDDLAARFGPFPVVYSLEVVEHVYFPRKLAACAYDLLEPGGLIILSTPYHGYLKNLMLAVTGKLDAHFTALWDHGHIKFWSPKTLAILLAEAGFEQIRFEYAGRIYPFSKSMFAIARKPIR